MWLLLSTPFMGRRVINTRVSARVVAFNRLARGRSVGSCVEATSEKTNNGETPKNRNKKAENEATRNHNTYSRRRLDQLREP